MYAFGLSGEAIGQIALDLDLLNVAQISLFRYGLLSNEKRESLPDEVIGEVEFFEAEIPLAMVTADVRFGDNVILDSGLTDTYRCTAKRGSSGNPPALLHSGNAPGAASVSDVFNRLYPWNYSDILP